MKNLSEINKHLGNPFDLNKGFYAALGLFYAHTHLLISNSVLIDENGLNLSSTTTFLLGYFMFLHIAPNLVRYILKFGLSILPLKRSYQKIEDQYPKSMVESLAIYTKNSLLYKKLEETRTKERKLKSLQNSMIITLVLLVFDFQSEGFLFSWLSGDILVFYFVWSPLLFLFLVYLNNTLDEELYVDVDRRVFRKMEKDSGFSANRLKGVESD